MVQYIWLIYEIDTINKQRDRKCKKTLYEYIKISITKILKQILIFIPFSLRTI
jgi:hypothetical protein